MFFNTDVNEIRTINENLIKQVLTESGDQDLGFWCEQSRDISTRRALISKAVNKMSKVWKSKLDRKLKIQLFRATSETILLYGCATWTLTKADEKKLDGVIHQNAENSTQYQLEPKDYKQGTLRQP